MGVIITEKDYPIRNIWLFKEIFVSLIVLPAYLLFMFFIAGNKARFSSSSLEMFLFLILAFGLVFGVSIICKILQRYNFHYSFEDHYVVLHQGIISKQNRNVPYGRIQGVFVNQGILDRILGIMSLTFEDFSQGGRSAMSVDGYVGRGKSKREALGFVGNKIHIPGLKKDDAEALKAMILQKVKENPIDDSQSGL